MGNPSNKPQPAPRKPFRERIGDIVVGVIIGLVVAGCGGTFVWWLNYSPQRHSANYLKTPTPWDVELALRNADPCAREDILQSFVGCPVEWSGQFTDVCDGKLLQFDEGTDDHNYRFLAHYEKEKFPHMKRAPFQSPFVIRGTIDGANYSYPIVRAESIVPASDTKSIPKQ